MICLQISIFELLNTTEALAPASPPQLWFAYKLVSLNYWIQRNDGYSFTNFVVICLQISIFELLNTTRCGTIRTSASLWFAYKLVSLNYWIQLLVSYRSLMAVVICLQISIFELLNTTRLTDFQATDPLWFAYKLVSLNYWIQQQAKNIAP